MSKSAMPTSSSSSSSKNSSGDADEYELATVSHQVMNNQAAVQLQTALMKVVPKNRMMIGL